MATNATEESLGRLREEARRLREENERAIREGDNLLWALRRVIQAKALKFRARKVAAGQNIR